MEFAPNVLQAILFLNKESAYKYARMLILVRARFVNHWI